VERRLIDPGLLVRIERLHQVDLHAERTCARHRDVLVHVLPLAAEIAHDGQTEQIDPQPPQRRLVGGAHGDLLHPEHSKLSRHGGKFPGRPWPGKGTRQRSPYARAWRSASRSCWSLLLKRTGYSAVGSRARTSGGSAATCSRARRRACGRPSRSSRLPPAMTWTRSGSPGKVSSWRAITSSTKRPPSTLRNTCLPPG